MPFVIHPRVRRIVGGLAATTCVAVFASTSAAMAASCRSQSVTKAFALIGDTSSYFPAPGGTFEGSAAQVGWSFDNAGLTPGNEPFYVNSPSDSQSATINSRGSATSPSFCLDSTMPSFRFVTKQVAGGSDLRVQLVLHNTTDWNGSRTDTVVDLPDGSVNGWQVVSPVSIVSALNLPGGASVSAALRFRVGWGGGAWQIDDVFVDPYRLG